MSKWLAPVNLKDYNYDRSKPHMFLSSGCKVYPGMVDGSGIAFEGSPDLRKDFLVPLYREQRWAGQAGGGSYVLDHINEVASMVPDPLRKLIALFHDLPEAITGDIPAPIKSSLLLAGGKSFHEWELVCILRLLHHFVWTPAKYGPTPNLDLEILEWINRGVVKTFDSASGNREFNEAFNGCPASQPYCIDIMRSPVQLWEEQFAWCINHLDFTGKQRKAIRKWCGLPNTQTDLLADMAADRS